MADKAAEITVYEFEIGKRDLLKAPERERVFFILLGHIFNEIVILNKIALANDSAHNAEDIARAESHAYAVQGMFLAKLLMAKIFEGWDKLFQKIFFNSTFRLEYEAALSQEAKHALGELGQFFANAAYVAAIRNDFIFHYPSEVLLGAIPHIQDDEEWLIYLSETNGNSLYYLSEMIVGHAMMATIGPNKVFGFAQMIADRDRLTKHLLTLLVGCINVFTKRHLKLQRSENRAIKLKVRRGEDLELPYYVFLDR